MINLMRLFYGFSVDIGIYGRLQHGELINFDYKALVDFANLANEKYLNHTIEPEELMVWIDILDTLNRYREVKNADQLYNDVYNNLFKNVTLGE